MIFVLLLLFIRLEGSLSFFKVNIALNISYRSYNSFNFEQQMSSASVTRQCLLHLVYRAVFQITFDVSFLSAETIVIWVTNIGYIACSCKIHGIAKKEMLSLERSGCNFPKGKKFMLWLRLNTMCCHKNKIVL